MPNDPPHDDQGSGQLGVIDDDMEDAVEYHEDLYNALTGRTLSSSLVDQVAGHGGTIDGWLGGDLAGVSDEDIAAIALGEAAQMFGGAEHYDLEAHAEEEARRGLLSRIKKALSRTAEAPAPIDETQASKRDALIAEIGRQIAAEKASAVDAVAAGSACAEDRVRYCTLAARLLAERPQPALECLETSRQLGRLVEIAEEGTRAAARAGVDEDADPAPDPRADVERQKDAATGDLRLEYEFLAADIAALAKRRDGLQGASQNPAFNDLRATFQPLYDAAILLFDEADALAAPDDEAFEISHENRALFRAAEEKYQAAAAALDTAEAVLANAMADVHQTQLAAFDKLCGTSGGEIERVGGDLQGGGSVVPKKGYYNVPTQTLDRVAAKIDAIAAIGAGGQFDPAHAELVQLLQAEVAAEMHGITERREIYDDVASRIATARAYLANAPATANTERQQALSDALDKVEDKVADDVVRAEADLTEFETELAAAKPEFDTDQQALEAFQTAHGALRKSHLDPYGHALKQVVKSAEAHGARGLLARDEKVHRSWLQKLRGIVHYEGKHALEHLMIEERMDPGSPASVRTAQEQLTALKTAITTDQEALDGMQQALDSADESDFVPLGDGFLPMVEDLASSGREIKWRERLKEIYEREAEQLKQFISKTKSLLEDSAQEAFANYATLLKAIAKRTKTLETVADWSKFLDDFRAFDATVHDYAARNCKPEAMDGATRKEQAADALRRCDQRIADFQASMFEFVAPRVERVARLLEGEIIKLGDGVPEAAEMQAVRDIIEIKEDELTDFADGISDAMDGAGLLGIADRLKGCADAEAIAIREEALRALRRRRDWLDTAPCPKIYRDNPFDSGAPALAMVAALSQAEAALLTLIKPS